jgi:hypothetical protein
MFVYCVCVVFCQVEVSARGRSLIQRSRTVYGVSDCDRKASTMRRPWPILGCRAMGGDGLV